MVHALPQFGGLQRKAPSRGSVCVLDARRMHPFHASSTASASLLASLDS